MFTLCVKYGTQACYLEVLEDTTINDVKTNIRTHSKWELPQNLELISRGVVLNDQNTIGYYGVTQGGIITLIPAKEAVPPPSSINEGVPPPSSINEGVPPPRSSINEGAPPPRSSINEGAPPPRYGKGGGIKRKRKKYSRKRYSRKKYSRKKYSRKTKKSRR